MFSHEVNPVSAVPASGSRFSPHTGSASMPSIPSYIREERCFWKRSSHLNPRRLLPRIHRTLVLFRPLWKLSLSHKRASVVWRISRMDILSSFINRNTGLSLALDNAADGCWWLFFPHFKEDQPLQSKHSKVWLEQVYCLWETVGVLNDMGGTVSLVSLQTHTLSAWTESLFGKCSFRCLSFTSCWVCLAVMQHCMSL